MDLFLQWTACIFLGQGKILTAKELNLLSIRLQSVSPMFENVVNMKMKYEFSKVVFRPCS